MILSKEEIIAEVMQKIVVSLHLPIGWGDNLELIRGVLDEAYERTVESQKEFISSKDQEITDLSSDLLNEQKISSGLYSGQGELEKELSKLQKELDEVKEKSRGFFDAGFKFGGDMVIQGVYVPTEESYEKEFQQYLKEQSK